MTLKQHPAEVAGVLNDEGLFVLALNGNLGKSSSPPGDLV